MGKGPSVLSLSSKNSHSFICLFYVLARNKFQMTGNMFHTCISHPISSFLLSSSNCSLSISNVLLSRFCLSDSSSLLPLSPNDSSVLLLLPYPNNSAKAEIFVYFWRDKNCLFWCVRYGAFVLLHCMF